MPPPATRDERPRAFPDTRWSLVLAAQSSEQSGSVEALESLCQAYWYPLYAFVRRQGRTPHDAQDLTQEFFCRLLEKRWLESADREKGRLRTFLMVALKNFMINEWRRSKSLRRGGAASHVAFDGAVAESRFTLEGSTPLPPDQAFDREWALTLLELTVKRLRSEFESAGKLPEFEALKDCLAAERGSIDYAQVASRLGASEGATRVAVHRLRKRFRESYREEIARTLADGADSEGEVLLLARACAGKNNNGPAA